MFPRHLIRFVLILCLGFPRLAAAVHVPPEIPGTQPVCASSRDCLELIRSADPAVKDEAVLILGKLKDPNSVLPLIEIVKGHVPNRDEHFADIRRDNYTVVTAVRALGMIGDRRALPTLAEFIKREPFIQLRVLAAEMIRQMGLRTEDIPFIFDLLNDPHTSVRYVIFEAIRRADDPISKQYTQRFINYMSRADVIEDSVTRPPPLSAIGVPIYAEATYLLYASASDDWIMRERPQRLSKTRWIHTFLTKDPIKKVVAFYESALDEAAVARAVIEKSYSYRGEEETEGAYIGVGVGFILKKAERPDLRVPVVIVSIYEDKILEGTAITISSPR